jgi:hypothetical protein
MPKTARTFRPATALVAAALAFGLAACGEDKQASPSITARITAAAGGSLSLDGGNATLTIPAGALSADVDATITELLNPPGAGANQTAASKAYEIKLVPASATLSQPMTVALRATSAPVHPQLGEIASLTGSAWTRLSANFVRPPLTVLALSSSTSGTYRVVFRTLRKVAATSPAATSGFNVFQYETFGNEDFFTGLGLAALLNAVSPIDVVPLGVQVDLAKVPAGIVSVMTGTDKAAKDAALASPATTVALVKAGAVVGVVDKSAPTDTTITKVGITCALCHQLVTPTTFDLTAGATALPIGPLKVNGAPNLKMDAGKILSLTQGAINAGLAPTLAGWGPNRFDVRNPVTVNGALDDLADNPTITPPIWNFVDLEAAQYPFGWDGLFFGTDALASQAEAVYHLVMNGKGAFGTAAGAIPPALRVTPPDRILSKLAGAASQSPTITAVKMRDVQEWMRTITSPAPGAFDAAKAERGWKTFHTRGCTSCHATPELSGTKDIIVPIPGSTGDLAGGIRPPSLRGLKAAGPPYFHDGRFDTLDAAVAAMSNQPAVGGLTPTEQAEVVEYLNSL